MPLVPRRRPLVLLGALARQAPVRLSAFTLVALAAAWVGLGQLGRTNEFRDSHLINTYEVVGVRTLVEHAQLPLWNPYSCGGLPLFGNPQSKVASPTVLLSAVMGPRRAEGVLFVFFLVLGMEGFFRWARLRTRGALGPALAAPMFALGGHFGIVWSLGWIIFLGFLVLPWVLLGVALLCRGNPRGLWATGGGFALMLAFGGTYPVPLAVPFVGLEVLRSLMDRKRRAPLPTALPLLAAGGLLTAGLCAFRLWPVLESLSQGPRVMAGSPGHRLSELGSMLLAYPGAGATGTVGIYYLGPFALALAAAGLVLWRRALWPLAVVGLSLWLAAGYAWQPSLFVWLRELPGYETLRYPARFLVPGSLFLAELAALGILFIQVLARRRPLAVLGMGMAVGAAVLGVGLQASAVGQLSSRAELGPPMPRVEQPFAQARGTRRLAMHFVAIDRGSISCAEAYPVPMSPLLRGDLSQEEYLLDPTAGQVRREAWTPNRLELAVEVTSPARVLVNQNWHPGWRASVGEVVSHRGLLAVDVPAGSHRVTLRYLPRSVLGGLAVSLLALGVVVAVSAGWPRDRRRRGRAALFALGLSVLPGVALGLIAAGWKEPKLEPMLTNPDGGPIVVDALPEGAERLDVRFELPVTLVALRVPEVAREDGQVPIELFWRVEGKVPRSVGVFVHILGPGQRRGADHEVLAGTYFFKNAPRGVLIRDAVWVSAHDWEPGRWRPGVGLWHASGSGERVPAYDAKGARVPHDRVDTAGFDVPPREPEEPQAPAP
jgi:hypothetical protein